MHEALALLLEALRRPRPDDDAYAARLDGGIDALQAAAAAAPAALAGEDQLRELAALVGHRDAFVASAALWAAHALVTYTPSPARSVQLARAEGMAAALEARLRGSFAAHDKIIELTGLLLNNLGATALTAGHDLLSRAPGFVAAIAEVAALSAPREAAERAGVDVGAVAAAAMDSTWRRAAPDVRAQLLKNLLQFLLHARRVLEGDAEAPPTPPYLAPALVALAACGDGDASVLALQNLGHIVMRSLVPRADVLFFDLAARGAAAGVGAALKAALERLCVDPGQNDWHPARVALTTCMLLSRALCGALGRSPKRAGGAAAAAWVAAAPRLRQHVQLLEERVRRLPDYARMPGPVDRLAAELGKVRETLELLTQWAAAAARSYGGAGSGGGSGGGGSGGQNDGGGSGGGGGKSDGGSGGGAVAPLHLRCCAACGRTRADGAQLYRCRGCGALTGVMYCGAACAREHWVRGGHRKVCEPASAQLQTFFRRLLVLLKLTYPAGLLITSIDITVGGDIAVSAYTPADTRRR